MTDYFKEGIDHYNLARNGKDSLNNYRRALDCLEKVAPNLLGDERDFYDNMITEVMQKLRALERHAA